MKKYLKIILLTLTMLFIAILGNCVKAASTSLTVSPATVTEGSTVTATVTINAAQWNLTLTANGKALNTWTETVNYKSNLSKKFKVSYKATEKGKVNFALKGDITDVDQTNKEISTSKSITVNAKTTSSNNGSTTSSNNNTPKQPTFTSANKTVYTTKQCNLRSSWSTSSSATSVEKGTELKLTGTSKETVNGYNWYRVQYKGATKYIASSLVTNTKPKEDEPEEKNDNNNLASLNIKGANLSPEFSKDVLQYTVQVGEEVTKLDIEAKTENSKAKVEIQGNEELVSGENTIKIVVTAEDNTTKTYVIKALKGNEAVATSNDTLKLSKLEILGVSFDGGFDPDKYTYDLSLNLAVSNLTITAEPNQEDAKMEIVGNQDFKEGENLITIMLTSADGEQTATYQIKVNLPAAAAENKNDLQFYLICAAVALAVIVVIAIIVIVYHKRNHIEEKEENQEDDEKRVEEKEVKEEKELAEVVNKKEVIDQFLNATEETKTKKTRGRHSV